VFLFSIKEKYTTLYNCDYDIPGPHADAWFSATTSWCHRGKETASLHAKAILIWCRIASGYLNDFDIDKSKGTFSTTQITPI
jgi:hypothetical protein